MKLREMSFHGLNNYVSEIAKLTKNDEILILGSGDGFLENILVQRGFKKLHSADLYFKNMILESNRILSVNLNTTFAEKIQSKFKKKFDVIIAVETIEHLESTANFLSNCKKLLKDNGRLIVSTPNLNGATYRADYVLFGKPTYFIQKPGLGDHINPIFPNIMEHLCDLEGLKIAWTDHFGSHLDFLKQYRIMSIKSLPYLFILTLLTVCLWPIMLFNRKHQAGMNMIFCIKKVK
jgi:2-polyprenyl-3-methyl-5-hydroxy-6-metoxy-1,4-benzoquinol methylase